MLLLNKVALVTGAGRGIGASVAQTFGREGATVAVHFNSSATAAREIADAAGQDSEAFQADLSDASSTRAMVDSVIRRYGRIDVLVNNASTFEHHTTIETSKWEDFAREFTGVVGTTLNPIQAVLPHMKTAGKGKIVNFIASLIERPAPEYVVHATAKSALVGLSRSIAKEYGPFGITANMVSPGMTLTDFTVALPEMAREGVRLQTPVRRLATPQDVANIVLFYACDLSDMLTGSMLTPDGGLVDCH